MGTEDGRGPAAGVVEINPDMARWRCDQDRFDFETTADIEHCPIELIGQPRAIEALQLGLSLRTKGYNIFVSGEVGTGRSTAVRRQLLEVRPDGLVPEDLVYVFNPKFPDQPRLLRLPAGRGLEFRSAMARLVDGLERSLDQLFESDEYHEEHKAVTEAVKKPVKEAFAAFEADLKAAGFALIHIRMEGGIVPDILPVVDGEPKGMDVFEAQVVAGTMTREEVDRMQELRAGFGERLEKHRKEFRHQDRRMHKELENLDREKALPMVKAGVDALAREFDYEGVRAYLEDVQAELLDSLELLREKIEEGGEEGEPGRETVHAEFEELQIPYAVNVVLDNTDTLHRPVIWETSPNYRNLFGTIEKIRDESGEWLTDHTRVRGGSLLEANGGFLVLDAIDMLSEKGVWPTLKRTLKNQKLEIQAPDPTQMGGNALKPEPIDIDLTVVLIGTPQIYRLLLNLDEDFRKIFKVKAEFATSTPRSEEEIRNYACFVKKKSLDDNLPPFHTDAVAAVVEEGVRLAGRQDRLTTRFHAIADLIREAGHWAMEDEAPVVREKHVDLAVERRIRRHDLVEEVERKRMAEGTVLLDLAGEKVGQINGLVILDTGDHVFGQPARITAVTAVGSAGIIDIERESEKSGAIHTKGVLILAGFLRARYAQDRPLALSASLCFEQNYGGIDGDSASSAELYALLSSLSGVGLKQGIAVTGSVNQRGEVQPIGGVNSKIEGYFDLCRLKGFSGQQGVLIPATNLPHLMLRKDVTEAVRRKEFRIWAVNTIEQGLEILTDQPSGIRNDDGSYPAGTVLRKVDDRLAALAALARKHRSREGDHD